MTGEASRWEVLFIVYSISKVELTKINNVKFKLYI